MAKTDFDTAVDDAADEIEQKEQTGEIEEIESAKEEKLPENHTPKNKLVAVLKNGKARVALIAAVLIAAILAVPMTRYALVGLFVKKQVVITVVDETTGKPVSDATVHYARVDAKTDKNGVATINDMAVGDHPLSVEKKYYETATTSYTVPIFSSAKTTVTLKATGRLATITVSDAISGNKITGALLKISDTTAVTDDKGVATVALAVRSADQPGTVTADGYNAADMSVSTKDESPALDIKLVPSGKVYFLSNRTGGFNIMSSTLDGKSPETVVAGTGKEVAYELSLSVSANRDYAAYVGRRDSDTQALYVLNTATKALEKVEENAGLSPIGWSGTMFYYSLYAYSTNGAAVDKRVQLVAYNAATKQRTVVDASRLEGDQWNYAEQGPSGRFQLVGTRLYYAKCWGYSSYYSGEQNRNASFMIVENGKAVSLKDVKQTGNGYCDTVATKPNMVYFRVSYSSGKNETYRYQPGKAVGAADVNDGELYNNYVTYLSSPNGAKTFWTELRDGKRVSFIGDSNGANAVQVSGADYDAYGWFGDGYVLYSKGGSELYVAAAGATLDGAHKVTDYYTQRGPGY